MQGVEASAYLAAKAILHPFQPVPRGVDLSKLWPVDRMRAAHRIVRGGRRRGDEWLEIAP
jgi:hypothetical protein